MHNERYHAVSLLHYKYIFQMIAPHMYNMEISQLHQTSIMIESIRDFRISFFPKTKLGKQCVPLTEIENLVSYKHN